MFHKYKTQQGQYFILILLNVSSHLAQTVKTSGDVHIADSAVGAVAGPGAHIGTASVVTQLHPPSKAKGVSGNKYSLFTEY